jgi:hypothetical protein
MSKTQFDGQMDFLNLLNEYTDDQGATVRVSDPKVRKAKPKLVFEDLDQITFEDLSAEETVVSEHVTEATKEEPKPEPERKPKPKRKPEPKPEPEHNSEPPLGEFLFKDCKRCWCHDCKHNSRLKGVPREMCGRMMPCPSCDDCIAENHASICEIGNAKEGCMTRAIEEGLVVTEEF